MADTMTKEQRSYVMSCIRSRGTKPELAVREIVNELGWVFRANDRSLPGTPDVVIPGARVCIEVNGCFWHWHESAGCPTRPSLPATNRKFWEAKLMRNRAGSRRKAAMLRRRGWRVLHVWECELRDLGKVRGRIRRFIEKRKDFSHSLFADLGGGRAKSSRPRSRGGKDREVHRND